jgi:hypothetical protein
LIGSRFIISVSKFTARDETAWINPKSKRNLARSVRARLSVFVEISKVDETTSAVTMQCVSVNAFAVCRRLARSTKESRLNIATRGIAFELD